MQSNDWSSSAHLPKGSGGSDDFKKWRRDTSRLIAHVFGENSQHVQEFDRIAFHPAGYNAQNPEPAFERAFANGMGSARAMLESMRDEVHQYWDEISEDAPTPFDPLARLRRLFEHFHIVARQLRQRHANRPTLDVADEYDVQDLLHALLRVDFRDVRPEEWTPSYAGGSSRIDFLLPEYGIVVETKKTRRTLTAREVGEELIIDTARYRAHPSCRYLLAFVYDPEGLIANPAGLERDLSVGGDELTVTVVVAPKGT